MFSFSRFVVHTINLKYLFLTREYADRSVGATVFEGSRSDRPAAAQLVRPIGGQLVADSWYTSVLFIVSILDILRAPCFLLGSMLAVCFVTPSFGFVFVAIFSVYISVTNYYRVVARELKR